METKKDIQRKLQAFQMYRPQSEKCVELLEFIHFMDIYEETKQKI